MILKFSEELCELCSSFKKIINESKGQNIKLSYKNEYKGVWKKCE